MTGPVLRCHDDDNLALLSGLGLLPPESGDRDSSARQELATAERGAAIERLLLTLWTEWRRVAPKRQQQRATKTAAWLQSVVDTGGCFTLGLPDARGQRLVDLCGIRVLFWPQGLTQQPLAVLTSSRIGRSDAARQAFVAKLKHVLQRIEEAGQTLLVVEETAGADFLLRAAQRASRPVLRATTGAEHHPEQWLSQLMQTGAGAHPGETQLFVSPTSASVAPQAAMTQDAAADVDSAETLPLRDRVAVALAETVWSLSARRNGNQHRLLQWRLTQPDADPADVRLVLSSDEAEPAHLAGLIDLGAIPWRLLRAADDSDEDDRVSPTLEGDPPAGQATATSRVVSGSVISTSLLDQLQRDDEWLIHWTRASTRPHGSQSPDEWLDEQLDCPAEAATGSLAALQQILRDGLLHASSDALRGDRPMVCFSAVPLRELVTRRRFQTHRTRWDFEPYGLCVRRRTLEALGARPVIYGDDAVWQSLPEPERPWFQQRFSGRGDRQIDWSEEAEWRVAGDVSLRQFGRDGLVVFCRQPNEAARLASVSSWPVIALDEVV